jgi:pimeloyl-ACP methyl ester carboxylesterase
VRIVAGAALAIVVLLAAALAAVGWVFSSRILVPAPYQLFPEFELIAVEPRSDGGYDVTLPLPPQQELVPQAARTDVQGRYGLLWEGGAGTLGEVVARHEATIVRRVVPTRGTPPTAGAPARVDVTLFADPAERGVEAEEVRLPGPLGALPGWWIPGREEDAVLVLHGRRRADRTEALRALPTLVAEGASVLVASYRNHDASPPSPDGFFHYGASEVDDALAALAWLEARGVRRVVLMGYSMGGSIQVGTLTRWPEGVEPLGLVLDSPLIDPEPVFALGARREGLPLPGLLAAVTTRVAGWRAGVDFAELDRRRAAPGLALPTLIYAGVQDTTVPIDQIDDFAAALPALFAYVRLDGVEHVEPWNADPEGYEATLAEFLRVVFERTAVAGLR